MDGTQRVQLVTELVLPANNLVGALETHLLARFAALERVNLAHNQLVGHLPSLVELSRLKVLNISYNAFQGSLPAFHPEAAVEVIDLVGNAYFGPLDLSANVVNLTHFDASRNFFHGSIFPPLLLTASGMVHYSVALNELAGTLPDSICASWPRLAHLNLANNDGLVQSAGVPLAWLSSLSGSLPPEFSTLSQLSTLQIPSASLSGTIPDGYSALTRMVDLQISSNDLEGTIPSDLFQSMPRLTTLVAEKNPMLSGQLPPSLFSSPHFDLDYVNFAWCNFPASSRLTWRFSPRRD
ncbi:ATP binding/protein serine/threonine kinase [Thecamonas trahens ATCC 50062]|uniref:ATP binding/protein serine/threonine kinase n=1 Tax=Thecamonas trahens ATCC 50062 TaxID=461836 RepID=A0A0L0DI67_THETB|nr:ATP binding/protein serine/threonine kinase [Thecamonas trahens ATCC 50062]KNC52054.1 ATP binding/protein serine/threonine kinase [Thecamonas trahens ATCC 50062]|eukprot:XP_013762060.1 ATP binding/protein serine/threonine kinase [Thecamonas trahens ATCC 50062]